MDGSKDNVENSTFGDRIKCILKHENIKSVDLAKAINVKPPHISQVIHNKKNLSDRTLKLISKTYNINLDWLVYGKGNMYIDQNKYNQILNRILNIFDSLHLEYQEEGLQYFEFLYRLQTKFDKTLNETIEEVYKLNRSNIENSE